MNLVFNYNEQPCKNKNAVYCVNTRLGARVVGRIAGAPRHPRLENEPIAKVTRFKLLVHKLFILRVIYH